MQALLDGVQSSAGVIALLGLVIALLALLVAWRTSRRSARIETPLAPSPTVVDDPGLERVLSAQVQRLDALARDVNALATRTGSIETVSRLAVQSAGLVRFNPFREDTGGNLSFALALLDANDNGVVLSSLHSRTTTRVYVKAITAGVSDQTMSEEETQALQQARHGDAQPA